MAQRRDQVRLQPPWVVAVLGLVTILCGATSTVPVYIHGEGGYPCIRTPGLVKTASGALLAFAGTRCGQGDGCFPTAPFQTLNHSDAVMKRSLDGGQTWSPLRVLNVATCLQRNHGAPIADHLHNTTVFVFNDAALMWIRSADDGMTWSAPVPICPHDTYSNASLSPGNGITLRSTHPTAPGRLLFVAYSLNVGDLVFFSDDGGSTWARSATPIVGGNEAAIVELANGTLLLNARDQTARPAGGRRVAVSVDGGTTWATRPEIDHHFGTANCMGSMLAPGPAQPIYFSHPFQHNAAANTRSNGTLFASIDNGTSFHPLTNIGDGSPSERATQAFAYSCLSATDDAGGVGLLYETGDATCSHASASCKIKFTQVANRSTTTVPNLLRSQLGHRGAGAPIHVRGCRDRFTRPFATQSIWNMPIGSNASYAVLPGLFAGESAQHRGAPVLIQNDQDNIVRVGPLDPTVDWYSQGWWGPTPTNHCAPVTPTSQPVSRIALPANFTTPPGEGNNALAVLLSDNRTVVQTQPAYRCTPGSPLFSKWGNATDGCPQQFPNTTDILGDGALGAHGGSGLSAIGGTVRLGELGPGGTIQHAIKLEFFGDAWYWGATTLQPSTQENGGRTQYTWPATGSDDDSVSRGHKPPGYSGTSPHIVPGALLALPPLVATQLLIKHPIALKIREALTSYGGYLVDSSSGYANKVSICMAQGVNEELQSAYNVSFAAPHGVTARGQGADLYGELVLLLQNLHAVVNNGPETIGGGGTPLVPLAPPLCDT
eukprot:m.58457 g.58457  ORF g.58457 m.58457 type:complete len:772 (+) comp17225_c0_seq1:86-2401(+)